MEPLTSFGSPSVLEVRNKNEVILQKVLIVKYLSNTVQIKLNMFTQKFKWSYLENLMICELEMKVMSHPVPLMRARDLSHSVSSVQINILQNHVFPVLVISGWSLPWIQIFQNKMTTINELICLSVCLFVNCSWDVGTRLGAKFPTPWG